MQSKEQTPKPPENRVITTNQEELTGHFDTLTIEADKVILDGVTANEIIVKGSSCFVENSTVGTITINSGGSCTTYESKVAHIYLTLNAKSLSIEDTTVTGNVTLHGEKCSTSNSSIHHIELSHGECRFGKDSQVGTMKALGSKLSGKVTFTEPPKITSPKYNKYAPFQYRVGEDGQWIEPATAAAQTQTPQTTTPTSYYGGNVAVTGDFAGGSMTKTEVTHHHGGQKNPDGGGSGLPGFDQAGQSVGRVINVDGDLTIPQLGQTITTGGGDYFSGGNPPQINAAGKTQVNRVGPTINLEGGKFYPGDNTSYGDDVTLGETTINTGKPNDTVRGDKVGGDRITGTKIVITKIPEKSQGVAIGRDAEAHYKAGEKADIKVNGEIIYSYDPENVTSEDVEWLFKKHQELGNDITVEGVKIAGKDVQPTREIGHILIRMLQNRIFAGLSSYDSGDKISVGVIQPTKDASTDSKKEKKSRSPVERITTNGEKVTGIYKTLIVEANDCKLEDVQADTITVRANGCKLEDVQADTITVRANGCKLEDVQANTITVGANDCRLEDVAVDTIIISGNNASGSVLTTNKPIITGDNCKINFEYSNGTKPVINTTATAEQTVYRPANDGSGDLIGGEKTEGDQVGGDTITIQVPPGSRAFAAGEGASATVIDNSTDTVTNNSDTFNFTGQGLESKRIPGQISPQPGDVIVDVSILNGPPTGLTVNPNLAAYAPFNSALFRPSDDDGFGVFYNKSGEVVPVVNGAQIDQFRAQANLLDRSTKPVDTINYGSSNDKNLNRQTPETAATKIKFQRNDIVFGIAVEPGLQENIIYIPEVADLAPEGAVLLRNSSFYDRDGNIIKIDILKNLAFIQKVGELVEAKEAQKESSGPAGTQPGDIIFRVTDPRLSSSSDSGTTYNLDGQFSGTNLNLGSTINGNDLASKAPPTACYFRKETNKFYDYDGIEVESTFMQRMSFLF